MVDDIAATHSVDPVSSSISQPAATDCRNDPMLDTTEAIHSARNWGTRSGSTAEIDMGTEATTGPQPPNLRSWPIGAIGNRLKFGD